LGFDSLLAFSMLFVAAEGPLDEKYAIVGAGLYLVTVSVGKIVATGFLHK
jgi:hypothetical protein